MRLENILKSESVAPKNENKVSYRLPTLNKISVGTYLRGLGVGVVLLSLVGCEGSYNSASNEYYESRGGGSGGGAGGGAGGGSGGGGDGDGP